MVEPGPVIGIPVQCALEPFLESDAGMPVQFRIDPGHVDGVTMVVTRPIFDKGDERLGLIQIL